MASPYKKIEGKRWELVGVEPDESKAQVWANNMRGHGEKVRMFKAKEGFALYVETLFQRQAL